VELAVADAGAPVKEVKEKKKKRHRGAVRVLGRELPREGGQEVQLLAAALRRMKDSLARSVEHAEAERRLTALVFEKLPDGLIVLDAKLHVLEANEEFARMIGVPAPGGRALHDLFRNRGLHEVFEASLKSGQAAEKTVRLADEVVWQVRVVPMPAGSRAAAVGVLRDVTRLLERPIDWDDRVWLTWAPDAAMVLTR